MMPPEKGTLTSEQHDALATVYEQGYWDDSRKTSQEDLADSNGFRDQLLSRHLRNGVKIAVGALLLGPGANPTSDGRCRMSG